MIDAQQPSGNTPIEEQHTYDKRGNLTEVYQGNNLINQYHFGVLNRLEKAVNYQNQEASEYMYNGLGHRVGKTIGAPVEVMLPTDKLVTLTINPTKKIEDTIDLTKQYHNLLQRTEDSGTTSFTWDSNVLRATRAEDDNGTNGEYITNTGNNNYNQYLQDELGSSIRFFSPNGDMEEIYSYDEFGQETINSQKDFMQPFTYTGYQRDSVANTYYAQAREYKPEAGRFTGEDIIKGQVIRPVSMNQYVYCKNNPTSLVDLNGLTATRPENAGTGASGGILTIFSHNNHSWIAYTDVETGVITSVGTWGNKDHEGINYNIEKDFVSQGWYEGRVSSTASLTPEQAKNLWKFINANDNWGYWNNCSNFAADAWKNAGQKPFSQHSWLFGIPTPGALARSISKQEGYQVNKDIEGGCDTERNEARSSSNASSSSFDSSAVSGAASGGENSSSGKSAESSFGSGSY